jgi:deaminated glutathione amidase
LSSILTKNLGAQILTYPSVFTIPTGEAHWYLEIFFFLVLIFHNKFLNALFASNREVLLRARAIETQSYVIASAQVGQHNEKRSSYGHSMVVDPW